MKIQLLTGYFYPSVHPRAFRAYELAKEFAVQGHQVEVFNTTTVEGFDYDALAKGLNIKIYNLGFYKEKKAKEVTVKKYNQFVIFIMNIYRFLLSYLLDGRTLFMSRKIANYLLKNAERDVNLFISFSTPFMDIYAASLYRSKAKITQCTFVADSGDPYYYCLQTSRAFYFKYIEKWVYKYQDKLTIPMEAAKPAYTPIIEDSKIRIIPQGFNFDDTPLAEYKVNEVPTFSYAGVFYMDIRNPKFLFDYLVSLKTEFKFRIFMRMSTPQVEYFIDKYKPILGEKLEFVYGLDRKSLIYELSKSDFLININNTMTSQLPSKLIDYGIAKRPIFSCDSTTFDSSLFDKFMLGEYQGEYKVDISQYDIQVLAKSFIDIVN